MKNIFTRNIKFIAFSNKIELTSECTNEDNIEMEVITSAKEVMLSPGSVRLFVCEQDNSKTYGRILINFSGYVRNGKRKK